MFLTDISYYSLKLPTSIALEIDTGVTYLPEAGKLTSYSMQFSTFYFYIVST